MQKEVKTLDDVLEALKIYQRKHGGAVFCLFADGSGSIRKVYRDFSEAIDFDLKPSLRGMNSVYPVKLWLEVPEPQPEPRVYSAKEKSS